jgi:septal ring-binding cell division protein DamX
MGTAKPEQMHTQLESLASSLELDKLYVYHTVVKGKPFMSVLYGSFPDRDKATKALNDLPKSLQAHRPSLRTVGGVLEEIEQVQ